MRINDAIRVAVAFLMSNFDKIVAVVKTIETELAGVEGADKRDAAVKAINKLIDIPKVPEWIEEILIGMAVDFAVWLANKWFGHDWGKKLEQIHAA